MRGYEHNFALLPAGEDYIILPVALATAYGCCPLQHLDHGNTERITGSRCKFAILYAVFFSFQWKIKAGVP